MKFRDRPKIVVCIPLSWAYVPRRFFLNFVGIMQDTQKKGIELIPLTNQAAIMDKNRDDLAKAALEYNPQYILWLDADQIYPNDVVNRLLQHTRGDKLIVGGVAPRRGDGVPLIYKFIEVDGEFAAVPAGEPLNRGLIEVDAMGFGGVMMRPKVLKEIPFPRFKMWATSKYYIGEDIEFFRQCKEKGIKAYCDTNLMFGHLHIKPVMFNEKWRGGK